MAADRKDEEPVGHILSSGPIVDFLRKLDRPVIALPGQSIYRVMMHAHGFVLPIEGGNPAIGLYTTYFIASSTVRKAEETAVRRLKDRWETFYPFATGELVIEVEEIERLDVRFRRRSRYGIGFYSTDD